jgi:hypothetical protein
MPALALLSKPKGEPMASTHSPTRVLAALPILTGQVLGVDLQNGDVAGLVEAEDLGLEFALVGQLDGDLVGAVDDVGVGQDGPSALTMKPEPRPRTGMLRPVLRNAEAAEELLHGFVGVELGRSSDAFGPPLRVPETLMLTTDGLLRATMLLMSGSAAVAAGAWETAAGAGAPDIVAWPRE